MKGDGYYFPDYPVFVLLFAMISIGAVCLKSSMQLKYIFSKHWTNRTCFCLRYSTLKASISQFTSLKQAARKIEKGHPWFSYVYIILFTLGNWWQSRWDCLLHLPLISIKPLMPPAHGSRLTYHQPQWECSHYQASITELFTRAQDPLGNLCATKRLF